MNWEVSGLRVSGSKEFGSSGALRFNKCGIQEVWGPRILESLGGVDGEAKNM